MENNDTYILNKIEKYIKERVKEYQNCVNKEVINYEHYRKLLNDIMNILIKRNN